MQQDDVLTIGISPPYAELLQSVANEDGENKGFKSNWLNSPTGMHPMSLCKIVILMPIFSNKVSFYVMRFKKQIMILHAFATGTGSHVGLYSKKYKSLDVLPAQARVVIPNHPVNSARALILLHRAGLIQLKDLNNELSTVKDIVSNPKQLQFI